MKYSANANKLDMELAFSGEEDVMEAIERLLPSLFKVEGVNAKISTPFQRMTYQEAMASYGSDKPDLRLGMKVCSISLSRN